MGWDRGRGEDNEKERKEGGKKKRRKVWGERK